MYKLFDAIYTMSYYVPFATAQFIMRNTENMCQILTFAWFIDFLHCEWLVVIIYKQVPSGISRSQCLLSNYVNNAIVTTCVVSLDVILHTYCHYWRLEHFTPCWGKLARLKVKLL